MFTKTLDNAPTHFIHFGSVAEMRDAPTPGRSSSGQRDLLRRDVPYYHDDLDEAWWGVPTRLDALDAIEMGWTEGLARANDALRDLEGANIEAPRSTRRRKLWGDEGDSPDPDKLRNGDFDRAYLRTRREFKRSSSRTVRVFCQLGGHCKEDAANMFWAGAAALRLVDLLEDAGYRVELICGMYQRSAYVSGASMVATTTLKQPSDLVNADQLAAVLCLSGFFRTYGFRTLCAVSESVKGHCGYAHEIDAENMTMAGLYEEGDIIVPQIRNVRSAIAFIKKSIQTIEGVEDKGDKIVIPVRVTQPDNTPISSRRILAEGQTWTQRAALQKAGFEFTKGSSVWNGPDNLATRAVVRSGLEGVSFRVSS